MESWPKGLRLLLVAWSIVVEVKGGMRWPGFGVDGIRAAPEEGPILAHVLLFLDVKESLAALQHSTCMCMMRQ